MILNLEKFIGKVAIVTGASSGIGRSVVDELVKHGVIVAGLARRIARIEEHAANLAEEPGKLYAFKCDLTKEDEIISTIKQIIEDLGDIHILVNNAGLSLNTGIMDGDTEMWKTMIDTNILGLCIASREVLSNMKEKDTHGHIININSVVGHEVYPSISNFHIYTATKFAVTALTKTMKHDFAAANLPIKITSISPGYVQTEFVTVGEFPDENVPEKGLSSENVAEAVIYALSTGSGVSIDEITITSV